MNNTETTATFDVAELEVKVKEMYRAGCRAAGRAFPLRDGPRPR